MEHKIAAVPAHLAIIFLRQYQIWVSPGLGSVCRFYPSCSQYAIEVIENFGLLRGSLLALKRLLKCHPFHPGGVDPPPQPSAKKR
ncbi:MAG: membrane protein insertion efficiency factor YidD [bacterium]|jgi:putative membrane protein insertion efficiency factor